MPDDVRQRRRARAGQVPVGGECNVAGRQIREARFRCRRPDRRRLRENPNRSRSSCRDRASMRRRQRASSSCSFRMLYSRPRYGSLGSEVNDVGNGAPFTVPFEVLTVSGVPLSTGEQEIVLLHRAPELACRVAREIGDDVDIEVHVRIGAPDRILQRREGVMSVEQIERTAGPDHDGLDLGQEISSRLPKPSYKGRSWKPDCRLRHLRCSVASGRCRSAIPRRARTVPRRCCQRCSDHRIGNRNR